MRILICSVALMLSGLCHPVWAAAPDSRIRAVRATAPITVDGRLDEPVWQGPGTTDFTQFDPIEGAAPTERTTVWMAYDDRALYVAARLEDSQAALITRRMARRDETSDSDLFTISIDPFLDRRSGYEFSVNPLNCIIDKLLSDDVQSDASWDGIWSSAVRVDDRGWTVEVAIPFRNLRFQSAVRNTWGIQVTRYIKRKNERDVLVWIPKTESGFVSRFGLLAGLDGIEPERPWEFTPYARARATSSPAVAGNPFQTGHAVAGGLGVDVRKKLQTNLVLNGTVLPDFGQVEVDPAVVNLTAFETYYPEKRPFFVEGAAVFDFGWGGLNDRWAYNWRQPQFFYSRRIGRAPQGTVTTPGFVDMPEVTDIVAAAKVTGKVGHGWNIGVLDAVTSAEHAQVDVQGVRSTRLVEPLTNYGVIRAQKEFDEGRRGVGLMGSAVMRNLANDPLQAKLNSSAVTGGVEGWTSLDPDKNWVLSGWAGASRLEGSAADILRVQQAPQHYFQRPDAAHLRLDPAATSLAGWSGRVILNKQRGAWLFNTSFGAISPGFDVSDAGFQYSSDRLNTQVVGGYRWLQPGPVFRTATVVGAGFRGWDFGGHRIINGLSGGFDGQLLSYWKVNAGVVYNTARPSINQTRGGPLELEPADWTLTLGTSTDDRRTFVGALTAVTGGNTDGGWTRSLGLSVGWRPAPRLNLSVGPDAASYRYSTQWVTRVTDAAMSATYGARYLFGTLDQRSVGLTFRVNWIVTPAMSAQVYCQTLLSPGRYFAFKELALPGSNRFDVFGADGSTITAGGGTYTVQPAGASAFQFTNPDFNLKSLRGTAVFRWEYRPGSTLFVVWTLNRSDAAYPGEFDLSRDFARIWTGAGTNVFMVKMTYHLSH